MNVERLIETGVRSIESLAPSILAMERDETVRGDIRHAVERGYFKPDEDDRLRAWQARYLTARNGLLETINELQPFALPGAPGARDANVAEADRLRAFLIAYTATCLLIRAARHLIGDVATHSITQRKLNEASPRHRIPRKQFTLIRRSATSPANAWRIGEAMRFAEAHRRELEEAGSDARFASTMAYLRRAEDAVRLSVRQYLKARLRYRWHAWRRRRASAVQLAMFAVMESFGRLVADVRYLHGTEGHRVRGEIAEALAGLLEPGDVVITRHDHALTNLFLPGYWPHASLHIGTEADRNRLQVALDEERGRRWIDPVRVLEAKKDGVRFRPLDETLSVDAVAVIRPTLSPAEIAQALARAAIHEGKLYNFDFDFFTEEKLVCTEVVYRAYDGLGPMNFELKSRAGRVTISAEDLLDMALDGRGFAPVAVYGAPGCEGCLVTGAQSAQVLAATYR